MQFRREDRSEVTINIAPLVDVVFLLVIFFAVSTTFLERSGIELTLPSSSSSVEKPPEQLTVWLSKDGTIAVGSDEVTLEQLQMRLETDLAAMSDKRVVLRADEATEHGRVVEVMDRARAAGAVALTVAAKSPE
jgi:biopolymer transport protein ExbD